MLNEGLDACTYTFPCKCLYTCLYAAHPRLSPKLSFKPSCKARVLSVAFFHRQLGAWQTPRACAGSPFRCCSWVLFKPCGIRGWHAPRRLSKENPRFRWLQTEIAVSTDGYDTVRPRLWDTMSIRLRIDLFSVHDTNLPGHALSMMRGTPTPNDHRITEHQ